MEAWVNQSDMQSVMCLAIWLTGNVQLEEFSGLGNDSSVLALTRKLWWKLCFPNIQYFINLCNLGMLKPKSTLSLCWNPAVWTANRDLIAICIPAALLSPWDLPWKGYFCWLCCSVQRQTMTELHKQTGKYYWWNKKLCEISNGVRVPLRTQQSRSGLMVDLWLCSWMSLHWAETHSLNFNLLFWKP